MAARPSRDLMAPDTEPTDDELATVMRAARDAALARKKEAKAWLQSELEKALAEALARPSPPK